MDSNSVTWMDVLHCAMGTLHKHKPPKYTIRDLEEARDISQKVVKYCREIAWSMFTDYSSPVSIISEKRLWISRSLADVDWTIETLVGHLDALVKYCKENPVKGRESECSTVS